jgi:hypothetical protein
LKKMKKKFHLIKHNIYCEMKWLYKTLIIRYELRDDQKVHFPQGVYLLYVSIISNELFA